MLLGPLALAIITSNKLLLPSRWEDLDIRYILVKFLRALSGCARRSTVDAVPTKIANLRLLIKRLSAIPSCP